MRRQHCEAMTLLMVICSLIQLVLVMGDIKSNFTSQFPVTTTVYNKYSTNTVEQKKSFSERISMQDELNSNINSTDEKLDFGKMNELKISREKSEIDNDTNLSRRTLLSRKILGDYNNGLKIVQYDEERIAKRSQPRQPPLAIKKRRQLSLPMASAEKIIENYSYIEVKDLSDLDITPISLPPMDYDDSDDGESYEEMDELLKLKRILNDEQMSKSNKKIQRGDMSPMIDSFTSIIDKEKVPLRGDIVTRTKRSYHDDELWGFAEDEGYVSSDEVETNINTSIDNNTSVNQPINQLSRQVHGDQLNLNFSQEKKLRDYILRNRPIIVQDRRENNDIRRPKYPHVYTKNNQLSNNEFTSGHYDLMEQKRPTVSTRNYNYPMEINQEYERINKIPVSAKIIISRDPSTSLSSIMSLPTIFSRGNFDNDIDFPAMNPDRKGFRVANFPAPQTQSPLKLSPGACVWAIVQCCPTTANNRRVTKCFDYMGCPGVNWDPNPCRVEIIEAARTVIMNYYASSPRQT